MNQEETAARYGDSVVVRKNDIVLQAKKLRGRAQGFAILLRPGVVIYTMMRAGIIHGESIIFDVRGDFLWKGQIVNNEIQADCKEKNLVMEAIESAHGLYTYVERSVLRQWVLPHLPFLMEAIKDNGHHVYFRDGELIEEPVFINYTNVGESIGFFQHNKSWFAGLFRDGRLHGGMCRCDFTKSNETQFAFFKGTMQRGLFHGHGELSMKDGSVYVGSFRRGKMHGYMHCRESSGQECEILFSYGKEIKRLPSFSCFMGACELAAQESPPQRPPEAHMQRTAP